MGGGTGTGGSPKIQEPDFVWYLSIEKYNGREIQKGLVKVLEDVGLKKGHFSRIKFSMDGIVASFEYGEGVKANMILGLTSINYEARKTIIEAVQKQIDEYKIKYPTLVVRHS